MIILGIVLTTLSVIGIIAICIFVNPSNEVKCAFEGLVCGAFFTLGLCILGVEYIKSKTPTAMDVYQGKTTLEYTIVDGVIKDSTVILKYIEE